MSIDAQWGSDLAKMVSDLPSTFVWGSQSVTCTASPVTRTDDVSGDGVLNVHDLEAYVVRADFSDNITPGVRAKVTVNGVAYYVQERELDTKGVRYTLRRV
jgi:hypothetical protein